MIDISARAASNSDAVVTVDDVRGLRAPARAHPSSTFPVHVLATDRYGLENLNNFDKIPPRRVIANWEPRR